MTKDKKHFDVVVSAEACKGCGYCRELCPKGVYDFGSEMNSSGYIYMSAPNQDLCVGCLTCVMACPDFAISVEDRG